MNNTKYSPISIQKGQNRICTFVYCEVMADCSSKVYNYLGYCKWPKLAVLLLHIQFVSEVGKVVDFNPHVRVG